MLLDNVVLGDCLEVMNQIDDKSIDMILCDLPFSTTASKWDKIIDTDLLWIAYKRIIKDKGCVVLFASGQFSHKLLLSGLDIYKYKWIWVKNTTGNFINAKNRPLTQYEEILIFSKGTTANKSLRRMNYYPQADKITTRNRNKTQNQFGTMHGERPSHKDNWLVEFENYPTDILKFNTIFGKHKLHPNEKPQDLLSFLIKSYTLENDLVLDNTCGSGSTLLAAKRLNRRFIGIEKEEKYYNLSKERIK